MSDTTTNPAVGCCGNPPQAGLVPPGPVTETAAPCCGSTTEARQAGSCCGPAAKREAVASGQGCCG
jgi:hypothetical protein